MYHFTLVSIIFFIILINFIFITFAQNLGKKGENINGILM